ncbi:MAG: hypothetical protein AB8B56_16345 [Crocinitomicaceae bacterium]
MSWTDEEIDKLFKDGAGNQSFEYDASYFNEMEAALPVNGKGKDFLWMGTALVFIAVLTTGYFVNNANNTSFNTTNDQLANLELNTTDNTDTENNSIEISTEDQTVSNNGTELTDLNGELSTVENAASNSTSSALINGNLKNTASSNIESTSKGQQNGPLNSMYNLATRNVSASRNQNVNQSTTVNSNGVQTQPNDQSEKSNLSKLRTDIEANGKKQFAHAPITASLEVNDANQLDQGLNRNVAPSSMPPVLAELHPKSVLYFELNAGMSQSLITPSELMSKSFGGGVGVETYLGNFNLTTGLNFKASYHDDLDLVRSGKVYGFGSEEGANRYDIQRIYSIEMPIMLGYSHGQHNFNVGVRPSLVVGTRTEYKAYENQTLLRTEIRNGLIEAKVDGETYPALKRFGVKPTIGYAYRMKQWTIGANLGVQLMQSVNEQVMDGFNNQLPIDGQIYLRRTIRLIR